jgi:hypothetical protein
MNFRIDMSSTPLESCDVAGIDHNSFCATGDLTSCDPVSRLPFVTDDRLCADPHQEEPQ